MQRIASGLTWCLLITWTQSVLAEPAWTRDGNCTVCHTVSYTGAISVFGHDATANPAGRGEHKVFRAPRNQSKSLYVATGLGAGDRYVFGVSGFRSGGIASGATLVYGADCDWANWSGPSGTYTYSEFGLAWGTDPSSVTYDLTVGSTAIYDYYELVFIVAGKSASGDLFFAEEHAYLEVRPPNTPPLVGITSPADGALIRGAPLDIPITANASDAGGSVVRVEFLVNGTKIGEDTTVPYEYLWTQVSRGTYSLTAKATDNDGSSTTSASVGITVEAMPGDMDGDADIDQTDYGLFQRCLTGSSAVGPGCALGELNGDNTIDADDVRIFQQCLSGPDVRGEADCAD